MRVLDIDVPDALAARWRRHIAPEQQPFFVPADEPWPGAETVTPLPPELHDTYRAWRLERPTAVIWHDESSFMDLSRPDRARLVRMQVERRRGAVPTVKRWSATFGAADLRAQADGHRFVWWPSLVDRHPEAVLADHVDDGQPRSRHAEVRASTWTAIEQVLPGAERLAGTFSDSTRANCFGTTMAATGLADDGDCVLRDQFEAFLTDHCSPGGDDAEPGTVLVWRDLTSQVAHSAVTLGDGWALEKPSQTWWTPRVVLETRQLIRINSTQGLRLERHRLPTRS